MTMQEALIVEADPGGDLGLRHPAREQVLRKSDATMGDVGVRRQPNLLMERPAEAKFIEPRVRRERLEADRLGDALVEQGACASDRCSATLTPTGFRAARRTQHVDQRTQGVADHPSRLADRSLSFTDTSHRKRQFMRIFLTGATGFIGSQIIPQLLQAGHQVLGLTRSDAGSKQLAAVGAEAHRGDLDNPATLRSGAEKADAVIHCAFDHDFSRFVENCQKDRRNIAAMGDALVGSTRPLIITSGAGLGSRSPGELASEEVFDEANSSPRKISEEAAAAAAARGVNVSIVRLPQVHDTRKQGLISPLIENARAKGRVAYLGEGKNRFAAAHVSDVARLYRLAVERAEPHARYHAVAEEGVSMRDIAEALGRALKLPVVSLAGAEAKQYFGWMDMFASLDIPASSAITQEKLAWKPMGPGLIADLDRLEISAV